MDRERGEILPKFWLSEEEIKDSYQNLKVLYGTFALSVWREQVGNTPDMPNIVLTVADNWSMITLCAAPARSALEKLVTESGIFIAESSDILERSAETADKPDTRDIIGILKATKATLEARHINSERITVLDRTSVGYRDQVFDFKKGSIIGSRREPEWGRVVKLRDPGMEVYIITHGYEPKGEGYLRDLAFGKDLPDAHLWG